MTKTKKQLRAEAVERLKSGDETSLAEKLLGSDLPRLMDFHEAGQFKEATENALIDLLTDDNDELQDITRSAELRERIAELESLVRDMWICLNYGPNCLQNDCPRAYMCCKSIEGEFKRSISALGIEAES